MWWNLRSELESRVIYMMLLFLSSNLFLLFTILTLYTVNNWFTLEFFIRNYLTIVSVLVFCISLPMLVNIIYRKYGSKIKKIADHKRWIKLQLLTVAVFTFLFSGYFSTIGIDSPHDAIMLKPAIDFSRGLIPFKEVYVQYGILNVLLQGFAVKIFGEYLIIIKGLTAFFYFLSSILIFRIFSKIIPSHLAFIACLLWIILASYTGVTFHPWSSVYAQFFLLLSVNHFFRYLEKNKNSQIYLSGFSVSLVFLFRQPVGIFLFISYLLLFVLLYILNNKNKVRILTLFPKFLVPWFAVISAFFIYLFLTNTIDDWFLQTMSYSVKLSQEAAGGIGLNQVIVKLFSFNAPQKIWAVFPLINLFFTIALFLYLNIRQKINTHQMKIFTLGIVSLASWMQYYPVNETRHFYWSVTPMIGILFYVLFFVAQKVNKIELFLYSKIFKVIPKKEECVFILFFLK